ncbi:hypothetical protein [Actinomycetospora termitidis]|uniref:Roadblock/LAMTOR2 domain-containing protein n=1 Tax=Actinomycetospora termitidis TaxID=3053470 RepID=A0ABT7MFC1_9PSEU|nr:hypothetical protein [Actinomycetospora sp. Odt1-22]MDL5159367.1 hypothetical protein [Actinomycetospora sp. Odt1-22]
MAALVDLPGARYVLVVDASGERVRGELGGPPEADLAVLTWARRLADVSRERGRAMEDVVLTTESAFHLVRAVPEVRGEDVWVALRIDRERGNLALARRALAGLSAPDRIAVPGPRRLEAAPSPARPVSGRPSSPGPAAPPASAPMTGSLPAAMPSAGAPMPLAPAPRTAPEPTRPAAGPGVPALALLPPAPGPRALRSPEAVPPPPAAPVEVNGDLRALDARDRPSSAVPGARDSAAAPVNGDLRASDESSAPSSTAGDSAAGPVDGDLRASDGSSAPSSTAEESAAPRVNGDLHASDGTSAPSSETEDGAAEEEPGLWDPRRRPLTVRQAATWRSAPEVPGARESAEDAPVPVIPAPRVAGSLFAPVVVVPPPPSPVDDDTTEVPAPVPYPIITAPPLEPAPEPVPAEEPAVTDAGLPRRAPGERLAVPSVPPETVAPAPAPAGVPGWSTEPSVLRRLLFGLRRLT